MTGAGFPQIPADQGHYESFFLRAVDPEQPRAAWIRYTVHKRPGAEPVGSLWCTLFDAEQNRAIAVKETRPGPRPADWIAIGAATLGPDDLRGSASGQGREAAWELEIGRRRTRRCATSRASGCTARRCRGRSSRARSPTRPSPAGWRRVGVTSRSRAGAGWSATTGAPARRALDLAARRPRSPTRRAHGSSSRSARVRLAGRRTPWVANGALALDGRRLRLGGLGHIRSVHVREAPTEAEVALAGPGGVRVHAAVRSPQTVGWVYADPSGGAHQVAHGSIAALALRVERPGHPPLELATDHGAAYELGAREGLPGVAVEPFGDP